MYKKNMRGHSEKKKIDEYIKQRKEIVEDLLNKYDLKGYIEYIKKELMDESVPIKIKINNIVHLSKVNDESVLQFLINLKKNTKDPRLLQEIERAINEISLNLKMY